MARTLISSPSFIGSPLPSSISRHGIFTLPHRRLSSTRVRFSFHDIPPVHSLDSSVDFNAIVSRAESLLYTLADATVAVDSATSTSSATVQKSGGWFGFISEAMEFVLKVTCAAYAIFCHKCKSMAMTCVYRHLIYSGRSNGCIIML